MEIEEYAKACDKMRDVIKDPETKIVGRVYMELAQTAEFWQIVALRYRNQLKTVCNCAGHQPCEYCELVGHTFKDFIK